MTDHPTTNASLPGNTPAANMRMTVVLVALVVLIGLAGLAGWTAHGDTLFWSLLQAGLAWCM